MSATSASALPETASPSWLGRGGSGRPVLVILAVSVFTHGVMLLNDGITWDGWLIEGFARRRNWESLALSFDSSGLPLYKYFHWVVASLPNDLLGYRLISFLALSLTAVFVYLISLETCWFSRTEGLWLALLGLTYPAMRVPMEVAVIPYVVFHGVFMAGAWLALSAERWRGRAHGAGRVGALACFYLSFNLNSQLVLYGGFAMLLVLYLRTLRQEGLKTTLRWALPRRADYWALPVVFWLIKKATTASSGVFKGYHDFRITPRARKDLAMFVENSVFGPIDEALRLLLSQPTLSLTLGLTVWAFCRSRLEGPERPQGPRESRPGRTLLFGFLLFLLAVTPYYAVGYSPSATGFDSRHAILVALPMAVLLLSAGRLIFGGGDGTARRLRVVFLSLLVAGFSFTMLKTHLGWLARCAKDRSIVAQLASRPEQLRHSVYWVRDTLPAGGEPTYKFWEWSSLFKEASGDETRLGLDVRLYTGEHLQSLQAYFSREYHLGGFDPKGPQALLTIRGGKEPWDDAKIAWKYAWRRTFRRDKMKGFLMDLTEISVEPVAAYPGPSAK